MERFIHLLREKHKGGGGAVVVLAGGAAVAQVLLVALLPITTRLYTPGQVGVLTALLSLLNVASTFATLRLSTAILLPKSRWGAQNIIGAAFVSLLLITAIFSIVLLGLSVFLDEEGQGKYFVFVLAIFFLAGLNEIGYSVVLREKQYYPLALSKIIRHAGGEVGKISLGYILGPSVYMLLTGHAIALLAATAVFWRQMRGPVIGARRTRFATLVRAGRKYKQFPVFHLPAELVRTVSLNAPIFFFAIYYDARAIGLLGVAMMMVAGSSALVAQSVRQVFLSQVARLGKAQSLPPMLKRYSVWMAAGGIAMTLFVWFVAEPVLELFFNDNWYAAADFARILSIQFAPQFLAIAIAGPVFTVLRRDSLMLRVEIRRLLLVGAVLACCGWFALRPEKTLLAYTLALSTHFTLVYFRATRECKRGGRSAAMH